MTDWKAVLNALLQTTAVTALVGTDAQSKPLIYYGKIPIEEKGFPAISVRRYLKRKHNTIGVGYFIINCYAIKECDSTDLAEAVNNLFLQANGVIVGAGETIGYPFTSDSNIKNSVTDTESTNTPVLVQVTTLGR